MITGTQNPIVGKDEIFQFIDGLDLFNSSNATYVWNIWKKKAGNWINITQKPPKMGKKVSFKFGEKVLGEEFKLEVFKATPKLFSEEFEAKSAGEFFLVPTSSKVPKIDKVILYNQGAKDPNKASYRDTLVAKAYCIAMFNQEVEFQLWEDDAPEGGHNPQINKNNQAPVILKARVNKNGIAEKKISLSSNASVLKAIANKYMMSGDKNEGANHEYYVTASYAGKIQKASQVNVDVSNPGHQPKPKDDSAKFPATTNSKTNPQPDAKGTIKDAYFVNDKNQKLSSVQLNTHVKVQILSSDLIGKYIQYVVWEKDFGVNDEIFRSGKIKIPGDICNTGGFKITESHFQKGIDLPGGDPDSDKQNYFLEIIVLDSTAESKKFGLDDAAPQQMEVVRSAAKVDPPPEKKDHKDKCFCNRDFAEKDIRQLVKLLKGSETIWEGQALKGGGRVKCKISDKSFSRLTNELNKAIKKYNIITCAQKMHFLAQVCEETGTFALSEETKSNYASSTSIYKGRGLLQLTGVKKKGESSYDAPGPYKEYADYLGDQNVVKTPAVVADNVYYCIDSGGWIWSKNKKMPKAPSAAVDRWGTETSGKSLNELAIFVDKYLELISVLLNGRNATTKMPNGWEKRKSNYNTLKNFFFRYDKFHPDNSKPAVAEDIMTFHIYSDGKIERHIPKKIKAGFENRYKYIYHDISGTEHNICTVDFILADKRNNGVTINSIPKGSIKTYNYPIGGNAQTAYVYENGDICVKGTKYGFKKYSKGSGKVELVRMKDSLNYSSDGVKAYYSFQNSQRRYCNPESYAGLIGALIMLGRTDVLCTGMCFEDATSYPSVTHPNGDSADTAYYSTLTLEQKKVDALKFFHFKNIYRGKGSWYSSLVGTKYSGGHEDHLHAGDFDSAVVKTVKK